MSLSVAKSKTAVPASTIDVVSAVAHASAAISKTAAGPSSSVPENPSWVSERPYLTHAHLLTTTSSNRPTAKGAPLGSFPASSQEFFIVDDVLSIMSGIEGRYISAVPVAASSASVHSYEFRLEVDPTLDPSLRDVVALIAPACMQYVRVADFIEKRSSYEYGLVSHALAAAMRSLQREYLVLIAQLEHQHRQNSLGMQRLWFFVQPALRTLDALNRVVNAVISTPPTRARGGSLLNILAAEARSVGGDERASKLMQFLINKAAVPFMDMLADWTLKGRVNDTYAEFMVEATVVVGRNDDSYWQRCYTVRGHHVPDIISRGELASRVLAAGKHLNVVRACDSDAVFPDAQALASSFHWGNDRGLAEAVARASEFASASLLDLLVEKHSLFDKLHVLRRFFLIDRGDWVVHFVDSASEELSKVCKDVSAVKLESLLELAVRGSSSADMEPYLDLIGVTILSKTASQEVLAALNAPAAPAARGTKSLLAPGAVDREVQLSGMETFTLEWKEQWPTNIVLNANAMIKYRWLFRQLWHYKHVERRLASAWGALHSTRALPFPGLFGAGSALLRRMLHFTQSLLHYLVFDVIEESCCALDKLLKQAKSVDDVITHHDSFLDGCITQFLLGDATLIKAIAHLTSSSLRFADIIESIARSMDVELAMDTTSDMTKRLEQRRRRSRVIGDSARMTAEDESYRKTVRQHEVEFDNELKGLLSTLVT
jgi:gamma-tubulin complex component 2